MVGKVHKEIPEVTCTLAHIIRLGLIASLPVVKQRHDSGIDNDISSCGYVAYPSIHVTYITPSIIDVYTLGTP